MTQVKVYLPKEADNYDGVLAYTQMRFANCFGGFTTYDATGGWVDSNGDTVTEPVTVIESYNDRSIQTVKELMEHISLRIFVRTNEDAIAYTIDNKMYFID